MKTSLTVVNSGLTEFNFQALLHTYLRIESVDESQICGLHPSRFVDQLFKADKNDTVSINDQFEDKFNIGGREIDRIYTIQFDHDLFLLPEGIRVSRNPAFPHVVVWNPWIEKSKKLSDFPNDGYKSMVCIEPGIVIGHVLIESGLSWTGSQILSLG